VEIQSYTFIGDTYDVNDTRKSDTDGDGLRAELDPDSDNGGASDGAEDLNKNGRLDIGETDPFNATDDPYIPPQVADFTYNPEKPKTNETTTFDGSTSYSEKGNIISYEWDFNDGNITTVTEPLINHTYTSPAKYNVTLTVTDNNTLSNTTSKLVSIFYVTDLNIEGTVNIVDITIVASAYGSTPGSAKWNEDADLNKDDAINIVDVALVAKDYGKTI
jgi:PKD repeat protein